MTPREILTADADRMGSENYGDESGSPDAITCPGGPWATDCQRKPGSDLCFACALESDAAWEVFCERMGMDPYPKQAA